MTEAAKYSDFGLISIPVDPAAGSWDRASLWPLGGQSFLAMVADAPSAAEKETGLLIEKFLGRQVPGILKKLTPVHASATLSPDIIREMVASLMTMIDNYLVATAPGRAYAACSLVLHYGRNLYVIGCGDTAVYLIGDHILRLSDTTRFANGGTVVLSDSDRKKPIHFREGVYLGGEAKCFHANQVHQVLSEGIRLAAMVSDGAEDQFEEELVSLLSSNKDAARVKETMEKRLAGVKVYDDLTVLLCDVHGDLSLESSMNQSLAESKEQIAQQIQQVNELKNNVMTLNNIKDIVVKKPEFDMVMDSLQNAQNSIAYVGDRVSKLEEDASEMLGRLAGLEEDEKGIKNTAQKAKETKNLLHSLQNDLADRSQELRQHETKIVQIESDLHGIYNQIEVIRFHLENGNASVDQSDGQNHPATGHPVQEPPRGQSGSLEQLNKINNLIQGKITARAQEKNKKRSLYMVAVAIAFILVAGAAFYLGRSTSPPQKDATSQDQVKPQLQAAQKATKNSQAAQPPDTGEAEKKPPQKARDEFPAPGATLQLPAARIQLWKAAADVPTELLEMATEYEKQVPNRDQEPVYKIPLGVALRVWDQVGKAYAGRAHKVKSGETWRKITESLLPGKQSFLEAWNPNVKRGAKLNAGETIHQPALALIIYSPNQKVRDSAVQILFKDSPKWNSIDKELKTLNGGLVELRRDVSNLWEQEYCIPYRFIQKISVDKLGELNDRLRRDYTIGKEDRSWRDVCARVICSEADFAAALRGLSSQ